MNDDEAHTLESTEHNINNENKNQCFLFCFAMKNQIKIIVWPNTNDNEESNESNKSRGSSNMIAKTNNTCWLS